MIELEEKLIKLIESLECEFYDMSFLKENDSDILRVSIKSKDGNTTLDKCQAVSELISPLLDIYEPCGHKYILEVSSPGIERILKTPRHFKLSIGEEILIKTFSKDEIEAIILRADDTTLTYKSEEKEYTIPYEEIKKAKTIFRWE